ncbi:flagellar export chaperone FliS [Thiomicrorhabdus sp. Milos-T2]|uniref:flagellar export chaperone FliS n=1 Tax=Thiomicrorhabdus sp. Milos-T2 TaxID=90814 RepID=UPI000493F8E0|nr:flagellar export chaperone FliS [Thiomicrorhabdus sp. Milos-T2]
MNALLKKQFAQQYANNYVETSVSEASPHKLVAMLYEGALRNMKVAKVFIEQKNYEKKAFHLNKTLSIINGLKSGVNLEKGGDVASNFFELYDYCYRSVFDASRLNDAQKLSEVIEIMEGLNDSWKQMPVELAEASALKIEREAKL